MVILDFVGDGAWKIGYFVWEYLVIRIGWKVIIVEGAGSEVFVKVIFILR